MAKNEYNKIENKMGNVLSKIFVVYFYSYLVLSIISMILYFFKLFTPFRIITIIMLIFYLLELLLGIDRNFFGILGVIILGIIGFLFTNSFNGILLGITIGIFVVNVLWVLFCRLVGFLIRKWSWFTPFSFITCIMM